MKLTGAGVAQRRTAGACGAAKLKRLWTDPAWRAAMLARRPSGSGKFPFRIPPELSLWNRKLRDAGFTKQQRIAAIRAEIARCSNNQPHREAS